MARGLTAGMLAQIATGIVKPLFLYEGQFVGGNLNLFTGRGTLSWDAKTWTGDGGLLQCTSIQEVSELQAVNFTISLKGDVSALMSTALSQVRRGQLGQVWLGLLDADGDLVADPYLCAKARADKPGINPDPAQAVVSVAYESRLIVGTRKKSRRYTTEDQAIDYPGDLGFDGVPSLQDKVFTFGRR